MSYTPTEWKSGDVITSENLNKLEQGVAAASGGGGGGGLLIVVADEPMETLPAWIAEFGGDPVVFETNVTYAQFHAAFSSSPIGLSAPGYYQFFDSDDRRQLPALFTDYGLDGGFYMANCEYISVTNSYEPKRADLAANAEDGTLYFLPFQPI